MSKVCNIAASQIGNSCTISGVIYDIKLKRPKRNLSLVEISIQDKTGILIVTVFRQPWLADRLKVGEYIAVAGKVTFDYGFKRMTNPFIEPLGDTPAEVTGSVIPVHGATTKITPAIMRRLIKDALISVDGALDPLPLYLREKYKLESRQVALQNVHFPQLLDEAEAAKRRLKYEELLMLQLFLMLESNKRAKGPNPVSHVTNGLHVDALANSLPFTLTDEQQEALKQLFDGMQANRVVNHMLLGDVGTGKTIIAAFGLAAAADSAGQAFLLAPTEVLAVQHAKSIGSLLESAGVTYALLTGSTESSRRTQITKGFSSGEVQVLIGTHALLEDDVVASNLTFVVIDEQQRFGVEQREKLLSKGQAPDALYLTATPIPRSLALALFGNLTLSYIKKRPIEGSGRTTTVVSKKQRGKAYDAALEALKRNEQVYVVCPLIGIDSEARTAKVSGTGEDTSANLNDEIYHPEVIIEDDLDFNLGDVAAATQEAKFLQDVVFSSYKVALLHGGLPADEKRNIMDDFRQGEINVLVSTTVIEVGVDVPNATCMIIEDADRFGLSQLHQLRGRVGRGEKSGEVYLVSATTKEAALKRLSALEQTDDGFKLAEYDLALRKEGDILGNRQSGASALKLVNVIADAAIIEAANKDARNLLAKDPDMIMPQNRALKRELDVVFGAQRAHAGG